MEHFFELPVQYNGTEHSFKGRLVTFAYTYKFYIVVDGIELVFERDDDQRFRVITTEANQGKQPDPKLVESIIDVLEKVNTV